MISPSRFAAYSAEECVLILGEADIRGIPNTKKDKDLSILDFSEMDRLSDAVADFVVSADGKIY